MAKEFLFKKLGNKYPQFKKLSSNHFSKLDRKTEMYPIIRQLRTDFPKAMVTFFAYSNSSTSELAQKLFTFVKENIK